MSLGPCIELGTKHRPHVRRGGRLISVARWIMGVEDDPQIYVLHRCNNKRCINRDHLYLGTQSQNVKQAIDDGLFTPVDNITKWNEKMASKAETRLRQKIVKACKDAYGDDLYIAHPHGSQFSAGLPDLHGCLKSHFFAMEVKTPQNRRGATKLQQAQLEKIDLAGGFAGVISSVDEALNMLADMEDYHGD